MAKADVSKHGCQTGQLGFYRIQSAPKSCSIVMRHRSHTVTIAWGAINLGHQVGRDGLLDYPVGCGHQNCCMTTGQTGTLSPSLVQRTEYVYDAANLLVSDTDAAGIETTYTHDGAGRPDRYL